MIQSQAGSKTRGSRWTKAEHPGGLCFHLTGVHLGTIRARLRQELNIGGNVILLNPLEKFNNHSRKNTNGKT